VRGLLERTSYARRELVIVDNGTTEAAVLSLYRSVEEQGCGVIVPFDRPFNFSAACNAGATAARGDLLLFLNNDIEVIEHDWLDELVRWSLLPEIGVVGAKLLYPDRTIQHAGVVFGIGLVGHIFSRAPEGTSGLFGSSESYRNYLGVTGACQMMRREVFERLGRYDERFRLSFSDIVICLEAWKSGYRVVYTPHARLIHHESHTRKREDWPDDLLQLVQYLEANKFVEDPYFHPELNARSAIPALRPSFGASPRRAVRDYMDRVLTAAERISRD
jgi:GT2 family glycosyltransferase